MLSALHIQNFAIVQELHLEFNGGMTAFTGETGAGKSIMIDALMLALGARADASVVRPQQKQCDISATFLIEPESPPDLWLKANDLDSDDIILRRIITQEGRSKAFINGTPFPLQKIKELSQMLVHIHGQHEHQTLLQPTTHREQLDKFGNLLPLVANVHALYKNIQTIKQKRDALEGADPQKDRQELLHFQIQELASLNLIEHELDELNRTHHALHHAKDYCEKTEELNLLINDDESANILSLLHQTEYLLKNLPSDNIHRKNAEELIQNAIIQVDEALSEIHTFSKAIELDPEKLEQIESRLSLLHKMARKYHCDPNRLLDEYISRQEALHAIENAQESKKALQKALEDATEEYQKSAKTLSDARKAIAPKLAQRITETIQPLGMPHGILSIQITPLETPQANGMDKVEYYVCPNPGMVPDSLQKIASGGELSRISLAIQIITAERGATPTLLFDEVDVGIGGATATLVGRLLQTLGRRLQVFCVTHQPSVAASAHHHMNVAKKSDGQTTTSIISQLPEEARIEELARMLGGTTPQGLAHAKELLFLCHNMESAESCVI